MTDEQLKRMLADGPKPGTRWQHYQGGVYEVITTAIAENDLLVVVVYRNVESEIPFTRSLAQWHQDITYRTDDGTVTTARRFTRIG